MAAKAIKCGEHGSGTSAVVCRHHLDSKTPVGFVENSNDPDDLQAWCLACEEMFVRDREMTPEFRAFNNFGLVCVECYAQLKARHTSQ